MIWITGSSGMLALKLQEQLKQMHIPYVTSAKDVDITNYNALEKFAIETERSSYLSSHNTADRLRYGKIQWIVNCAAYTDVDKAENDEDNAYNVNCLGAKNLSILARTLGAKLIHISTNFVFDGKSDKAYKESDKKNPCNVYGKTKLEGENAIAQSMTQYYIIRSSWLYGFYGTNFVSSMIKLMNEDSSLQVISDQESSPTSCSDLSRFIISLIEKSENAKSLVGKNSIPPHGIYHYANSGKTSLYEFALAIYHYGKKHGKITNECKIEPCSARDYATDALRPDFAVLDCTKSERTLKIKIPTWKTSLEFFIKNLNEVPL